MPFGDTTKPKLPDPPKERVVKVQSVDKKIILLAKAQQIIQRLFRYKAFSNRPHSLDMRDWLLEYEAIMK